MTGVPQLEAHARFHPRLPDRLPHGAQVFQRETERFLDDEMFAGLGRANGLLGVLVGIAANGDDMDGGICEHLVQIVVNRDVAAVLRAEFRPVEGTRRTDCRDLAERCGVDTRDMSGRGPTVADETNVVFLHGRLNRFCPSLMLRHATAFAQSCQSKRRGASR